MSSSLVFNRVYRLKIQSIMLVFSSTPLVNCCPYNLLTGSSTPPPPPLPVWIGAGVQYHGTVYIQCETGEGGGDQRPPTEKHMPASTFTGQFLRKVDISCLVSFIFFINHLARPRLRGVSCIPIRKLANSRIFRSKNLVDSVQDCLADFLV